MMSGQNLDNEIKVAIARGIHLFPFRTERDSRYDLLPISYIAQHYFGKSKAWLYQRLNGNKVRGKVYTLNDEQKNIFNSAVKDIARQIGSVQLS